MECFVRKVIQLLPPVHDCHGVHIPCARFKAGWCVPFTPLVFGNDDPIRIDVGTVGANTRIPPKFASKIRSSVSVRVPFPSASLFFLFSSLLLRASNLSQNSSSSSSHGNLTSDLPCCYMQFFHEVGAVVIIVAVVIVCYCRLDWGFVSLRSQAVSQNLMTNEMRDILKKILEKFLTDTQQPQHVWQEDLLHDPYM